MQVKIEDFLEKWSGDFRIEDKKGSVYGDDRRALTSSLLSEKIMDVKLEQAMWTKSGFEAVLVIDKSENRTQSSRRPWLEGCQDYPRFQAAFNKNMLDYFEKELDEYCRRGNVTVDYVEHAPRIVCWYEGMISTDEFIDEFGGNKEEEEKYKNHFIVAIDQDGLEVEAYVHVLEAKKGTNVEEAAHQAAVEFCRTPEGAKIYQENGGCFNWGDFSFVPNCICQNHGFSKGFLSHGIKVDFNEHLVSDKDLEVRGE